MVVLSLLVFRGIQLPAALLNLQCSRLIYHLIWTLVFLNATILLPKVMITFSSPKVFGEDIDECLLTEF